SGVRGIVVALGINDILRNPNGNSAADIADGLRDLTRQAHQRGLRVTGATLMPFGGHRGWTPEKEQMRQEVNTAIRSGEVFDHYVDFDKAVRDPYDARKLRPEYDSGDHLHPSDAGFRRMGESFDLSLLRKTAP
ncbi:SGNH/GDSL hydrolase family protein, partial [Streptomyces fulvissimus]